MDSPINEISKLAIYFLIPELKWEPYVPKSTNNLETYSLLLKNLGSVTLASLSKADEAEITKNPVKNLCDEANIEKVALSEAVESRAPLSQALKDQQVIQALLQLRESGQILRRTPGMYGTIIRSPR